MMPALRLLPRTLVGRVFALYTVTLVAFVALGLGLFYRYQFTVELEEAQLRAEALSEAIVPSISDSAVIGDYDSIRRTLQHAVYHSSFASASYLDLAGGVVRAPREDAPDVAPPEWLLNSVASRLYDTNRMIKVGGRDYGVLRLSFAPERIAGPLWHQTRIALALGLLCVTGGLLLIRFPLVRWLGNLGRIQAFEQAMQNGELDPAMLAMDDTPLEFRSTFEVLGRAAASLQSQRVQAAVTLGAIADSVYTLDAAGRIVLANPAACAITGHELNGLLGRSARELLPPVFDAASDLTPWAGRRTTLTPPDRPPVVLDTSLSAILAPTGEPAGYVLVCRDVTERHALDQRLRAELQARETALDALRKVLEGLEHPGALLTTETHGGDDLQAISAMISRLVARLQVRGEQLDAIFALSADGFISFDARRRANYVSPAFARLTGLPEAEVLAVGESEIEAWLRALCDERNPWRGFDAMRRDLRQQREGAPPRRELIELVRPVKRVLEVGLREGSTEVISQVLSLRDVTHESEVDQMKSEFLSTAAHELRTPMASIFGFAELMIHRRLSPERQQEVLATIHRQTQLMINIVNELLDLARIEARRGKDFELQTLDLAALVAEVLHDFKPPQERALPGIEQPAQTAPVRVDRDKLVQAIGNVLSNAYKYSPEGGAVGLRLVRGTHDGQAMVGIEIRDQGIGLAPHQMARVSERFYRADASGSIPGTGLGMSIVKEILELLGGRLALASTPGLGTTVTLWLPCVAAPSERSMERA